MSDQTPPTLRQRRFVISTNVLIQIIAVLLLAGMANWLVARHHGWRLDWTRSNYYKLSEKTTQVLRSLKAPVKVVVFLPQTQQENEYVEKTIEDVRNLLAEFQYVAGKQMPVEYVDPQRDYVRAQQLVTQYKLDRPDLIIFESGDRHKYVRLDDCVVLEQTQGFGGESGARIKAFKGEGVFLSAIQAVTEEKPAKVYFLAGNGERDLADREKREGYAALLAYIRRDNITPERWNLLEKQAMPPDAGAVIIAGPKKQFTDLERNLIADYLKNHGRLMVLLEPRVQTGLEMLLLHWGVQVDDTLVVNQLLGMINVTALGDRYADHPITAKLAGINTMFPYARSVRRAAKPKDATTDLPVAVELVQTPEAFWGETNPDNKQVRYDANEDLRGPLPLAVAAELGQTRDVKVELARTRLVVVGSAGFVDNGGISAGNVDFFMSALNWLLQREQLLAVSPKTPDEFRLDMTTNQARAVYAFVIGVLPLAVGVIGFLVWWRRRK
jgi:ABC-type uncharacterized transport system involved in gliding motility auxiliary subunit